MDIQKILFSLKDEQYAAFQGKLTPNIPLERIIGVRVPKLRELAKKIKDSEEADVFLKQLPHEYYDENMLHGLLLSGIKDYCKCIERIDEFLPFVDNWAVCDTMSPAIFKKHKEELIVKIMEWMSSKKPYTIRFGIGMLMSHYLDDDYREEYLKAVSEVHSEEYYVEMMVAWFFATALTKQWDTAVKYIEDKKLDIRVHNKTIQKAIESYRIEQWQKEYLRSMKIKKNKIKYNE